MVAPLSSSLRTSFRGLFILPKEGNCQTTKSIRRWNWRVDRTLFKNLIKA
jgi:hypothetical protein